MKNRNILATLIVVGIAAIVYIGCKKDISGLFSVLVAIIAAIIAAI